MINAFFSSFEWSLSRRRFLWCFLLCRRLFSAEAFLFSLRAPIGLVLVLACRVCFSLFLGCFGVPICRRSIAFLFHWFRVLVLARIFDVAWCRIAILFPQGCSSSLSLPGSAVLGWFAPTPSSFEASSYHSPLFNASGHPWFFGSSLSSSMPEITRGFLGSLFSVMFLGLSWGCLLFVLFLLGSMFSFQF